MGGNGPGVGGQAILNFNMKPMGAIRKELTFKRLSPSPNQSSAAEPFLLVLPFAMCHVVPLGAFWLSLVLSGNMPFPLVRYADKSCDLEL